MASETAPRQYKQDKAPVLGGLARPKTGSRASCRAASWSAKPVDAITLLKDDHRQVQQWVREFEHTDDARTKQELSDLICKALRIHTRIEEELFYPAAYDALDDDGDDLLDEAAIEHACARALIGEIEAMRVGEPLFDARVRVLGEYIDHHVREEESELFPECRDSGMELKALGKAMAVRKEQLGSQ